MISKVKTRRDVILNISPRLIVLQLSISDERAATCPALGLPVRHHHPDWLLLSSCASMDECSIESGWCRLEDPHFLLSGLLLLRLRE